MYIADTRGLDHVELGPIAVVAGNQGADTKGSDAGVECVGLDVEGESLGEDLGGNGDLVEIAVVLGLVLGVVDNGPAVSQKSGNGQAIVLVNGGNPPVGPLDKELGVNQLLHSQNHSVLAAKSNAGSE